MLDDSVFYSLPFPGRVEETNMKRAERHRTPFSGKTHLRETKNDLERDSGFSDASSEYLSAVDLTDSEDAGRFGRSGIGGRPVAVMSGSYAGLSPMIIMNNFVLKQPSPVDPAEGSWGFPAPVEAMPPSQVVLLQPMVSNSNSGSSKTGSGSGSETNRQSKSNILKSYPRIAPHPADLPTKRSSKSRVSGSNHRPKTHHRSYGSPNPQQTQRTKSLDFGPIVESLDKCPSPLASKSLLLPNEDEFRTDFRMDGDQEDSPSTDGNKRKRFSNTYNILNKSGLLGITMRTKQLIKENKNTQGQLRLLQEQTELLLEALGSGDPQLWTKLQLSMQQTEEQPGGAKAHRI